MADELNKPRAVHYALIVSVMVTAISGSLAFMQYRELSHSLELLTDREREVLKLTALLKGVSISANSRSKNWGGSWKPIRSRWISRSPNSRGSSRGRRVRGSRLSAWLISMVMEGATATSSKRYWPSWVPGSIGEVDDDGNRLPENGKITRQTKYLVLGRLTDPGSIPDADAQARAVKTRKHLVQMIHEAKANGVPVIRMDVFLKCVVGFELRRGSRFGVQHPEEEFLELRPGTINALTGDGSAERLNGKVSELYKPRRNASSFSLVAGSKLFGGKITVQESPEEAKVIPQIEAWGGRIWRENQVVSVSFAGNENFNDASFGLLRPLKNLAMLDLSNTPVTDDGLKELSHIKTLATVYLTHTEVTDSGVEELKKSLPILEILR